MAHTLTTNVCFCYLNAASVTDNALVADLLVLTAVAFPVLGGTEYSFTEQTVLLGLECSVVDRLGLPYLAS